MISFDVSVTGGQIANALASDAEECAYAFQELAETGGAPLIKQMAEEHWDDPSIVVVFLRDLANAIEDL